ncbi:hypothetical protein Amet_2850 [Alkaliphilus metalliredigens QYMF]|uniref:DUF4355 domain-containing protein n=1 Tax=Alkaliphilus metalliredigens (strain QYMF) TaxID=293826 RepID=A6TS32_ALKMQ|nr:hypothetical protein [Alkaliphilus metalliredigens]ABR49000.1 hypothetical protein Amet_2850 [Alkaliphilus metalliredigens QYMF]
MRTSYTKQIKDLEKYKPKDKTDAELALEQKMADLETKQKEIEAKERQYKVQDTLAQNELPKDLAKYLNVGDDEMETIASELGSILNNHLMNNSYKPKDRKKNDGMTKEQFRKLNYSERESLHSNSPELYKKLSE